MCEQIRGSCLECTAGGLVWGSLHFAGGLVWGAVHSRRPGFGVPVRSKRLGLHVRHTASLPVLVM